MGSVGMGVRDFMTGRTAREALFGEDPLKAPDMPAAPGLPPPIEEVEAKTGRKRKGRASTILTRGGGSVLGSSNKGKKTVLG